MKPHRSLWTLVALVLAGSAFASSPLSTEGANRRGETEPMGFSPFLRQAAYARAESVSLFELLAPVRVGAPTSELPSILLVRPEGSPEAPDLVPDLAETSLPDLMGDLRVREVAAL